MTWLEDAETYIYVILIFISVLSQ